MATLKDMLNKANPNELASLLQSLGLGDMVRAFPTTLRSASPHAAGASPYDPSSTESLALPDDAKAHSIFRAWAKVGTGTPAELVVDAFADSNAAPAAGHCAVSASGNIMFASADAWTSVDLVYLPEKGFAVQLTLPVVSDAIALPAPMAGAILLCEAESLAGTVTGKFTVLKPQSGLPASSGQACLDLAHANVSFKHSDGVTSARIKVYVPSPQDVNALLEANAPFG